MGNDYHSPVLFNVGKIRLYYPFRFIIESGCRFIKDQDLRIGYQCPGNRDSLTLPPGECAVFVNDFETLFCVNLV